VESPVSLVYEGEENSRQQGVQGAPKAFIDMAKGEKEDRSPYGEDFVDPRLLEPEGKVIAEIGFFQRPGTKSGQKHDQNGRETFGGFHRQGGGIR
jgi:hypothetical protein